MPHVYKFPIGAKVVYTNEFGVCFGVRTIIAHDEAGLRRIPYRLRPAYHYEGSSTPWFPVEESRLQLADGEDIARQAGMIDPTDYFFKKYGRLTTQDELDSLLDGDPWEGER